MDQVEADLVLLSTEAVHSKAVDANLLAEFVDCPGAYSHTMPFIAEEAKNRAKW